MKNISNIPKKIHLKKSTNTIELEWADNEIDKISGDDLRRYCACSACRAHLFVGMQLITDNPTISDIHLMSNTGLQIIFADGHDRGIFPWNYLRAIPRGKAMEMIHG